MDRKDDLFQAKLSEQAERYHEMVEAMGRIACITDVELTAEEQMLLATGYKRLVGQLRESWRKVVETERHELAKGDGLSTLLHVAKAYRAQLERELRDQCSSIIQLLDNNLLQNPTSHSRAFYLKLKADHHRYQAEFFHGADRKEAAGNALLAYKNAASEAERSVPATDTLRLGIALNFSMFYYDILKAGDRACNVAQKAFDDGIAMLSDLDKVQKQQSLQILQLLREHLAIWRHAE